MTEILKNTRIALELAEKTLRQATLNLANEYAANQDFDNHQVVEYDLAHCAAGIKMAEALLEYGEKGETEAQLTSAFGAQVISELLSCTLGREKLWGVEEGWTHPIHDFLSTYRSPTFLADLAEKTFPAHLDPDFEMLKETFHRFASAKIIPVAQRIHRENMDIPEEIISGVAKIGGFAMSVPEEYSGFAQGNQSDYLGMVIATEELSRASLGAGGSLITRPEILTRALVQGGTEEQKQTWLPRLANGETMVGVAVTEPDFGSDVANIITTATPANFAGNNDRSVRDGEERDEGWIINGVKTWCTFAARADVLMLLARTDPDRSKGHRGLSMFIVPKPRGKGTGFRFTQTNPDKTEGILEGRAIDTIGYRGMHSYEISLSNWWVPDECLIGGKKALGRGFYLQMQGFENGRLQTAARAIGLMQAAYEAAQSYASQRIVFGMPIAAYQLTKVKLARMTILIEASRQFAYKVARLMAENSGSLEASMLKAYVCKAAEWVTREALQIHGGMGYAEEFDVSRYFVDARVLSIFEGADEILALKVIARKLVQDASG
ncbi:MAG: acyl-CoA/acyl-ACP dehydrogenase [Actinobacteria bacterium]|nr:acyl-CoA/acyl-ACP dehydrogenase [Actinomycetota bacterium]MCL6105437.1 acyl-CoA/acyl-ACP dehydrogenase [Actinomycetota bacterium]